MHPPLCVPCLYSPCAHETHPTPEMLVPSKPGVHRHALKLTLAAGDVAFHGHAVHAALPLRSLYSATAHATHVLVEAFSAHLGPQDATQVPSAARYLPLTQDVHVVALVHAPQSARSSRETRRSPS